MSDTEQNLRSFNEDDDYLVLKLDSPLPRNIRRVRSVLMDLGICDAESFINALAKGAKADPLHLCRMVQSGLLHDSDIFGDNLRFVDTDMYVPIVDGDDHVGECCIDGVENSVSFGVYVDSDISNIKLVDQATEEDILDFIRSDEQSEFDDKVSLLNFFRMNAQTVVQDRESSR